MECERLGAFTGRSGDVGVVLDLMIHDLDLVAALVRAPLKSFDALGMSVFGEPEDIATAHLHFTDGCVASIKASRVNSTPKRTMRHLVAGRIPGCRFRQEDIDADAAFRFRPQAGLDIADSIRLPGRP